MKTTATGSYMFEIDTDKVKILPAHPKSGLVTIIIPGTCIDKEGNSFSFIARNNLDMSYADRFKVNWNGSKPRLPLEAGHGFGEETTSGQKISTGLYMTRGARIAIARKCIALFPTASQLALAQVDEDGEE